MPFRSLLRIIVVVPLALTVAAVAARAGESAAPRPDANRFTRSVLVEALNEPMLMQFDAAGRIYWNERQNGGIRRLDEKTGKVDLLGTIPNDGAGEAGFDGFALAPDFATSKNIYIYYAAPVTPREMRLSRITLDAADQINLASEKIMLRWGWEPASHMGGGMTWDARGNLYLTVGDDTSAGQYSSGLGATGQDSSRSAGNSNDYRGKILRIHPEADGSYTIPAGNLFPPGTPLTKPEIYTMGNRNPWRPTIDSKTGYLHWGEVGPDGGVDSPAGDPKGYDEFNVARSAGNFGWPFLIGYSRGYRSYDYTTNQFGAPMDPARPLNLSPRNTGIRELPPAIPAALAYPYAISEEFPELNGGGRMADGGPVFRRADFAPTARVWPDFYEGKWIIADFVRNWIMVATLNEERSKVTAVERLVSEERFSSIMDVKFGPSGDLYVLEYGTQWNANNADARLSKITFNAGNRPPRVIASADKVAGATPLAVKLSATGTVDYDGDALRYEWDVAPVAGGPSIRFNTSEAQVNLTRPGSYRVSLTVTDQAGLSDTKTFPIVAGNEPPQVKLEFTQGNRSFFIPGQAISYRATVSDREDGAGLNGVVTAEYVPSGITSAQLAAVKDAYRPTESFRHVNAIALMATSDCRVCHQTDAKSVGPSFTDISRKYKDQAGALEMLTQKVITGGAGNWGQIAMAAHPNFTQAEATSLVEYVLSTADTSTAPQVLPAQGTYTTAIPAIPANAPRLGGGGPSGLLQNQQAAIAAFNNDMMPVQQAVTAARTALTAASLTLPADPDEIRTKASQLAAAEQAAALARSEAFGKVQASDVKLTAQQVNTLKLAAGGAAGAGGGGRGGAGGANGAFVLRASYQDKGANGVAPILAGDIVLLRPQLLAPETADIRSAGITYTPSRDPGFFIMSSGAYFGFRNLDLTGIGRIEITALTQFYQWPTMQGATVEFHLDSPGGPSLGEVRIYPVAGSAPRGGGGGGAGGGGAGAQGVALPAEITGTHDVYFVFVNPAAKSDNQLLLINNVAFRPAAPAAATP
jgi:cytochrome c